MEFLWNKTRRDALLGRLYNGFLQNENGRYLLLFRLNPIMH